MLRNIVEIFENYITKSQKLFQNILRKISEDFEKYFFHFREAHLFQKIQKILPKKIVVNNLENFKSILKNLKSCSERFWELIVLKHLENYYWKFWEKFENICTPFD